MMWMMSLLLACSTETVELTPETVAQIADEIAASPATADDILATRGATRQAFEDALFDIAADAAKTDAYLGARKK